MEHTIASALGALAGVVAGLILAGVAGRRQPRPVPVPVRANEPVRRRRRRKA